MRIIATSGYFNPLHIGHVNLMREAKNAFPDASLVVIVNNDAQVALKGSVPFMRQNERMEIVKAIRYVDHVMLSIDNDRTVLKSLMDLKPDVFVKGGDSTETNTPELEWCKKAGIQVVFGIGGEKIQSSAELIRNARAAT